MELFLVTGSSAGIPVQYLKERRSLPRLCWVAAAAGSGWKSFHGFRDGLGDKDRGCFSTVVDLRVGIVALS